ncbi:ABC transporter permease [Phytohabitans flavus]|uniref:ABC transporter permease n=1 Tax=Phytohabitans flavus TaxID=1076124 RepID=A0A6F8XNH7_9ACTN|nr:ABC transporter permease [Phytohabitans flavus]BCB75357.1 ABC transporter permease [Phytohabitans flavus]
MTTTVDTIAAPWRKRSAASSVGVTVGGAALLLALGVALLGPLLAPFDPVAIAGRPRLGPSAEHLLGTDQLGRDLLSRVLHGGWSVVAVPTLATLVAFGIGAAIGVWTGLAGGHRDLVTSRLVDVLISLPPLLMAIVFISAFGSSAVVLVGVTALFFVPRVVRVVRGATAAVVASDYVAASRARGDSTTQILRRDVVPNISGQLVVEFGARLSNVVMFVATLNYLGLGVHPPQPSWGLMVAENTLLLRTNPLAVLVPAALIAALAVGVSLVSDRVAERLAVDVVAP